MLIDPITSEPRYVGMTTGKPSVRLLGHIRDKGKTKKVEWIQKLLSRGVKPNIEVVYECSIDDWKESEMFWISSLREFGFDLTNITDGGDSFSSETQSASARAKRSISLKRTYATTELRSKKSAFLREMMSRPETRLALLNTLKKTYATTDLKQRRIQDLKRWYSDPKNAGIIDERRIRRTQTLKNTYATTDLSKRKREIASSLEWKAKVGTGTIAGIARKKESNRTDFINALTWTYPDSLPKLVWPFIDPIIPPSQTFQLNQS